MAVHVLLVILQLTLLQWSMQLAQAVPVGSEAFQADCLAHATAAVQEQTGDSVMPADDCCADHMGLGCQYHCSAGAFAFLSVFPVPDQIFPEARDLPSLQSFPNALVVRSLYRPPRHILA